MTADRLIRLQTGCAAIPERLLLAHAQGKVVFITGAGTSMASGLPDFKRLVDLTYAAADTALHALVKDLKLGESPPKAEVENLKPKQRAELGRYIKGDWDVVLGMLERRIDGTSHQQATVRKAIEGIIRRLDDPPKPSSIHRSLIKLSDRGDARTIVTTNFDLLLEDAARAGKTAIQSYSLGAIPRPSLRPEFGGIFHIHGALDRRVDRQSDVIITDQDFGELYLRRRTVGDFIYDAARLFHLVLVGYSANDAPMRYLLNAVAADGSRFEDLKERFTFVASTAPPDDAILEDWKGRGITPIAYNEAGLHKELADTFEVWASLSAINGKSSRLDSLIRKLVKTPRSTATDEAKDLFDHLYRRGNPTERNKFAEVATKAKADLDWLTAILKIGQEPK